MNKNKAKKNMKKSTEKLPLAEAKEKVIKSILNENRTFDMRTWTTMNLDEEYAKVATCATASCLAGHIEACWPTVAKRIAKGMLDGGGFVDHSVVADKVWKEVTGKKCRFDFFADTYEGEGSEMADITREEAVEHIKGRSKTWPLI